MQKNRCLKVAVFSIAAEGHVNPMLAVAISLAAHSAVKEVRSFGAPELSKCFVRAGLEHVEFHYAKEPSRLHHMTKDTLAYRGFLQPQEGIVKAIQFVREYSPDVILYDPFSIHGYVAAVSLQVPAALLITFPGYGALPDSIAKRYIDPVNWIRRANQRYQNLVGWNILEDTLSAVFFARADLAIVTTVPAFSLEPTREATPTLRRLLSQHPHPLAFVGPCLGTVRSRPFSATASCLDTHGKNHHRRRSPSFPMDLISKFKQEGKRILLFSLGTNLTGFRFSMPVGGAPSGRKFLLRLLKLLIKAFGDDHEIAVIAALGNRLPSIDEPGWPANFIVRDYLPQLTLLNDFAEVFLTHHGANSTYESILAGVPMISLPGYGDQLACARLAINAGVAVCPWDIMDPYNTCSPDGMRRAAELLLQNVEFSNRCRKLAETFIAAGGADEAAHRVLTMTRSRGKL